MEVGLVKSNVGVGCLLMAMFTLGKVKLNLPSVSGSQVEREHNVALSRSCHNDLYFQNQQSTFFSIVIMELQLMLKN